MLGATARSPTFNAILVSPCVMLFISAGLDRFSSQVMTLNYSTPSFDVYHITKFQCGLLHLLHCPIALAEAFILPQHSTDGPCRQRRLLCPREAPLVPIRPRGRNLLRASSSSPDPTPSLCSRQCEDAANATLERSNVREADLVKLVSN